MCAAQSASLDAADRLRAFALEWVVDLLEEFGCHADARIGDDRAIAAAFDVVRG